MTNEPLGSVSFSPGPGGLSATGEFVGFYETDLPHETEFRLVSATDQAAAFYVTIHSGVSGERRTGRLMVGLPAHSATGEPRGTLMLDGGRDENEVFQIYLDPDTVGYGQGSGSAPVGPDDGSPFEDASDDPPYDNPGFGIYAYTYAL